MTLSVRAVMAERGFEVAVEVAAGEHLAVLGPNGSGKSTLLGVLAGSVRPDAGAARLGDRVLFDLARRTWLPPHRRRVALLAQDALLFPHLSVLENVAFGPRAAGMGRAVARSRAEHWLGELGVDELAHRKPGSLSGGQAQRVAIARALAVDPDLLLLDEPMASLDVGVASQLRHVLRRVLAGRTTLVVTHDLLDAWLLSQRVVILDQGHIVESGPTEDVLRQPRTPFTARLADLNLVSGVTEGSGVRDPAGTLIEGVGEEALAPGSPAVAVFPPTAVSVYLEPTHGSPRNIVAVTVTEVEPRGGLVRVRAQNRVGTRVFADVTPQSAAELELAPGRAAYFSVKATAVAVYPA